MKKKEVLSLTPHFPNFPKLEQELQREKNPFCLFSLEQLGIHAPSFLDVLEHEVPSLPWDFYDVRRFQRELLLLHVPAAQQELVLLNDFYAGQATRSAIEHLVIQLPSEQRMAFESKQAHRRRTVSRFFLEARPEHHAWHIERQALEPLAQDVGPEDIRSVPRHFQEMDETVSKHEEFTKMLTNIADLAQTCAQTAFSAMEIHCWHSEAVARLESSASNSPEGIHQDGADYIVSALVLDRENVSGGMSRIFGPDKKSEVFTHTLDVGFGLFQADSGSDLWHDVTPIQVLREEESEGKRRTLGLDIKLCV